MRERRPVVIVGAGIVGCLAALELAPDHEVLVLERDTIAGGATGKASGLVTIVEEYSAVPGAAAHALAFLRGFDGTGEFRFTERPYVELRAGERDAAALEAHAAGLREAGFEAHFLPPGALDERFPGTFTLGDHVGGVVYEDAGWVDPYTYAMAVRSAAESEGATFRTGVEVTGIATADGAVIGVETTAGDVEAGTVVVAAGWRTRGLVADHLELPTRPYRYQTVNLQPGRVLGDGFPMAWDEYSHLYWRPEHNGELHVGGGTYFVREPGSVRTTTTEGFRRLVAETVPARLASLGEVRSVASDTCRTGDAATPDRFPVIDAPADAPEGLVVATGMHGFGIMASPVAGAAVRARVTGESVPFPLAPFSLDRFEDRSATVTSSYISETPDAVGPGD